jgi:hypothetical protein
MTTWLFNDSNFLQINDFSQRSQSLFEFMDNYLNNQLDRGTVLQHLSHMYVLEALMMTDEIITSNPNETTKWKHILSDSQYALLKKNRGYVIACMIIEQPKKRTFSKEPTQIHFIERIDTRVPKHDLAAYMISRYEAIYDNTIILLPREITFSAVVYWYKWFSKKYCCLKKNHVFAFCEDVNIKIENLQWEHLLALYEEE